MKRYHVIFVLLMFVFGASACKPQAMTPPAATLTAIPSSTPQPTATPLPTSTSTPQPTVTQTPTATPDTKATRSARVTAEAEKNLAVVQPFLDKYTVADQPGHLAWMQSTSDERVMKVNSYDAAQYDPLDNLGVLSDFVFQSDITWDSDSGFAGCGFLLRLPSEAEMEKEDYYELLLIRLQFAPAWVLGYYQYNQYQYAVTDKAVFSDWIHDDKHSTNTVAVVAQGAQITTYINGHKERLVEHNRAEEGRLAFSISQESGETECVFENSWVWVFDKEK